MGISHLFNLENRLSSPYPPFQFGKEAKIRYVHLVGALDVPLAPLGGLYFSTLFHALTASKKRVFGRFFSFSEFVLRITPLQIELES